MGPPRVRVRVQQQTGQVNQQCEDMMCPRGGALELLKNGSRSGTEQIISIPVTTVNLDGLFTQECTFIKIMKMNVHSYFRCIFQAEAVFKESCLKQEN